MKKRKFFVFLIIVILIILTGCSNEESKMSDLDMSPEKQKTYIEDFKVQVKKDGLDYVFVPIINYYDFTSTVLSSYDNDVQPFSEEEKKEINELISFHKKLNYLIINNSEFEDWVIDQKTFNLVKNLFNSFNEPIDKLEKAYLEEDLIDMRKAINNLKAKMP